MITALFFVTSPYSQWGVHPTLGLCPNQPSFFFICVLCTRICFQAPRISSLPHTTVSLQNVLCNIVSQSGHIIVSSANVLRHHLKRCSACVTEPSFPIFAASHALNS